MAAPTCGVPGGEGVRRASAWQAATAALSISTSADRRARRTSSPVMRAVRSLSLRLEVCWDHIRVTPDLQ
jgi:hypothetical protein